MSCFQPEPAYVASGWGPPLRVSMASDPAPVRVCRYELGSQPYQQLLRDYLARRLKLDLAKPREAQRADAIIRVADNRFAYVSFLADRDENSQLAAGEIGAGAGLYRLWLQNLEREYGRKQADAIRQVLAILAAAEQAHAWVFGEGKKIDPATGGALTPLPEQFGGIDIGLLAYLLDRDRPGAAAYDRIDPGLLFTLQMLQGVIWVSRPGAGTTSFRLALKEFLPAAEADAALGPMLPLMHARIATKALDAAEQIKKDGWEETGENGPRFLSLAPLLEAAMTLTRSEPVTQRWRPKELISLLRRQDDNLQAQGHALARVPWLTLIAAWPLQGSIDQLTIKQRNDLASSVQDRGIAKFGGADLAGAIEDYDAAIKLRQAIRAVLGNAWSVRLRNDLAKSLQNRGVAKQDASDLTGAITDYGAAIDLMQTSRAAMGAAWPVPLRNVLAVVLQNRGNTKADIGDLADAIADYDAALEIMHSIGAVLGDAWPVPLHAELAGMLQDRGTAKAGAGDLAGAIDDYDAAIKIGQAIRTVLGAAWSVPLQNGLARSLQNRGIAKSAGGDRTGAIVDYSAAINLMQTIRAALGPAWPVPLRNDLAIALQNRGSSQLNGGNLAGAIADFNAAIEIMQAIRTALREAWPTPLQGALAGVMQNRGNVKLQGGDLAGAIADYDAGMDIMQTIRALLKEAWPVPMQNNHAGLFYNRAQAKRLSHDEAGAWQDLAAGLDIQTSLVGALGDRCPASYRDLLDLLRQLQRDLTPPPRSVSST